MVGNNSLINKLNVFKGRIGEAIIQELFLTLGYKISFNGIEHKLPGLSKSEINKIRGKAVKRMRTEPDFFVVRDSKSHYLEVKYRKRGSIGCKELMQYKNEDTLFVLITEGYIGCLSWSDTKKIHDDGEKTILISNCEPLSEYHDFKFNYEEKNIVSKFNSYTEVLFKQLPDKQKMSALIEKHDKNLAA